MEYKWFLDISVESQMHEKELISLAEETEFGYEEPPRKKKKKNFH